MVNSIQLKKEDLRRKNFSPHEFFVSDTARKLGINNYPEDEAAILPCLMSTANMMQEIRDLLKKPIKINSAYRCPILNKAVGSSDKSQHLQGLACDFVSPDFGTPEEIIKFLHANNFIADQCFCEGSWVHISRLPQKTAKNRMMFGYYLPNKDGKRIFKSL